MVYGPFSLSDALDARLDFQAWINTESGYDRFQVFASVDNVNFYGNALSGNYTGNTDANGWVNVAFDLKNTPTLGDLRGQGSVWISLAFTSDQSITAEGVYVDDLALEKITGSYMSLTSDPYSSMQWSLLNYGQTWGSAGMDIQAREAWSISQGSSDIVIAIVDNGVDLTHPDLVNKLVAGYDATGRGSNGAPSGDDAHGTCVAGIAAAETDNGIGIAGIGRSVKIMPVRIFYSDTIFGYDISTDSWIADGIVWAVNSGADILNNSWAGGNTSDLVSSAISYAKTYGREGKGSVVVFAAGNENGSLIFPATLSEVLAVGALSPCGERKSPSSCDGEYWWGSNYGGNLAVLAPGVSMYTTDRQGSLGYGSGDYISNFNGTSAATPVVSGVAALMMSLNPNLTASQIEYAIKASADDLGDSGWDQYTGYGKVNAYYALLSLYEPVPAEWHNWFAVDARETPMVGDFNGDGMTDIITFTRDNPNAVGDVYVALSEGDRFGDNAFWNDWFAVSRDETVVIGDFNGDGMDDIATWLGKSTRQVYVATSYGSGMDTAAVWVDSIGESDDDVLKAGDVDGDGSDDLILFARQQGLVYVARSNGGGFSSPQVWHNWFAVSSHERPEVGDVDGDGRADIITFATDSPTAQGDVFVALSTGQMFEDGQYSAKWHDWFGVAASEKISIGDLDGDGRDDFLTSLPPPAGQTYAAYSQGTSMTDSVLWEQFLTRYDSDVPFAGDANGDGKADIILFRQSEGKVYVTLTP
jgi:subtilisin family serine protease